MTLTFPTWLLVATALGALSVCALCVALGAFIYHCGTKGKSPLPAVTMPRLSRPAPVEPPKPARTLPQIKG